MNRKIHTLDRAFGALGGKSIPFVPTGSGKDPSTTDPEESKLGKRWNQEKVRNQRHKEGQRQERTHHSGAQVIT